MRRGRWKRKNVSAGRSAPAQTSCRRRGKVGPPSRQSGTETRCPWGILWSGEVPDTVSADFRCRWPSLAGQGPTHRSAPTKRWEALTFRRGGPACPPVGKAPRGTMKRQRGQKQGAMRIFHPDDRRTEYAGQGRGKLAVRREPAEDRRFCRHRLGRPPSARRATAPERGKAFFSLDRAIAQPSAAPPPHGCGIPLAGTARFSFGKTKEKWGVQWTGYHHSRIPRAAGCRPYTSPKEGPRREPVWEITPPIPPCGPPTTPGMLGLSGRGWG